MIRLLVYPLKDTPTAEREIAKLRGEGYGILSTQVALNSDDSAFLFMVMEKPDQPISTTPDKPRTASEKNAEIMEMTGGKTKNSGSPMWRCLCKDGTRVNVFKHSDADKNNFLKFETAGYGSEMSALKDGERMGWTVHSIKVKLVKPAGSDFWDVTSVEQRPADAKPDSKIPDEIPF